MRWILTFCEGLLSFLSPCTLPLLPLYITYFASCAGERGRVTAAACFSAGFTLIFVLLGAFSGTLGLFLSRSRTIVQIAAGVLFIFYGCTLWDLIRLPVPRIRIREIAMRSLASAFLFGVLYSLLLTPCAGVYLAGALTLAAAAGSAGTGMALLFAYALGLAVPFLLCAALTDRISVVMTFMRGRMETLRRVCGTVMILLGVLTAFGLMNASLLSF